jgi:hypothetical protein
MTLRTVHPSTVTRKQEQQRLSAIFDALLMQLDALSAPNPCEQRSNAFSRSAITQRGEFVNYSITQDTGGVWLNDTESIVSILFRVDGGIDLFGSHGQPVILSQNMTTILAGAVAALA